MPVVLCMEQCLGSAQELTGSKYFAAGNSTGSCGSGSSIPWLIIHFKTGSGSGS